MVELRLIDQNDTFKSCSETLFFTSFHLKSSVLRCLKIFKKRNPWINELTKTKEPKTWESIRKKKNNGTLWVWGFWGSLVPYLVRKYKQFVFHCSLREEKTSEESQPWPRMPGVLRELNSWHSANSPEQLLSKKPRKCSRKKFFTNFSIIFPPQKTHPVKIGETKKPPAASKSHVL